MPSTTNIIYPLSIQVTSEAIIDGTMVTISSDFNAVHSNSGLKSDYSSWESNDVTDDDNIQMTTEA